MARNITASLDSLPQDILDNIFLHLTDVQPRAHPSYQRPRPPEFPTLYPLQRLGRRYYQLSFVRPLSYLAISHVSRALNFAIECFAQHMLAIIGWTDSYSWDPSPPFTFRMLLLEAMSKKRCFFCLTDAGIVYNIHRVQYCDTCNTRFMEGSIDGVGVIKKYFVLRESLSTFCTPIIAGAHVELPASWVFKEADVWAAVKAMFARGEMEMDENLVEKIRRAKAVANDDWPEEYSAWVCALEEKCDLAIAGRNSNNL